MDTKKKKKKISPYMVFSTIVIILLAIAFAFPLIKQIVFAFGLQNVHLFLLCTLGTFGVFALLYTFVYLLTARTYYRIVSAKA